MSPVNFSLRHYFTLSTPCPSVIGILVERSGSGRVLAVVKFQGTLFHGVTFSGFVAFSRSISPVNRRSVDASVAWYTKFETKKRNVKGKLRSRVHATQRRFLTQSCATQSFWNVSARSKINSRILALSVSRRVKCNLPKKLPTRLSFIFVRSIAVVVVYPRKAKIAWNIRFNRRQTLKISLY